MPTFLDQNRLAPKSVLRYRPLRADVATEEEVSTPRRSPSSSRVPASRAKLSSAAVRRTWVPVLIGMLAAILLVSVAQLVLNWTVVALDDLHYGRPRTYQVDAVVGHHDSKASPSHFLALNLHGRIEVIEWPGGDATHAKVYVGPQLLALGGDLVPVTLSFTDPKLGPVDMLVHVEPTTLLFHNNGQTFVPPTS